MREPADLLLIGHITRAHGLGGEVVVKLTTNRDERLAPGSTLHTNGSSPLVVVTSRPNDKNHLVRFVGIEGREAADGLRGRELLAAPLEDPDELWVHELVDGVVVDQDGVERGVVDHVEANPASDLLVLDNGALVPARFITSVIDSLITIDAPKGLFDLL